MPFDPNKPFTTEPPKSKFDPSKPFTTESNQATIGPGDPSKAQGVSNFDLSLGKMAMNAQKPLPDASDDDLAPIKKLIGMGAAHIAGVADPLSKLLLPKGMQGQDMQQAMDPEGEHNTAFSTGQAQALATPVLTGAALAAPAVAANPLAAKMAQGAAFSAGAAPIAKLLGLLKGHD